MRLTMVDLNELKRDEAIDLLTYLLNTFNRDIPVEKEARFRYDIIMATRQEDAKETTLHDKAKEAYHLMMEVIAEAKNHPDREFSAVFNTFEDDLSSKAKILVDWTRTIKEADHA